MLLRWMILISCTWLWSLASQADVIAVGLMKNMAILEVSGERLVIKAGQTKNDIKLLSANSKEALIEYQGQEQVLPLGASLVSSYAPAKTQQVRISRANNGQYFVRVKVNGRPIKMLVDAGANSVAMSSETAKRIGINYADGKKVRSATASGIVPSYAFQLDSVQVGDIKRYNIRASVIEGSHPYYPLLGMSFLNQLKISEEEGMMVLTEK